ncbi:hypothetical protein DIPPA_20236 [Diplonema papillatum]|nr:hypothetical protein DIPPA_20236 [Diplonema papillatum]
MEGRRRRDAALRTLTPTDSARRSISPGGTSAAPAWWRQFGLLLACFALVVVALAGTTMRDTSVDVEAALTKLMQARGGVALPSREAIVRSRLRRLREVQDVLLRVGHSEYFEPLVAAGLDRVVLLAHGTEADRADAMVKPAHWRRIVKAAAGLHRKKPSPAAPPATPSPPIPRRSPAQLATKWSVPSPVAAKLAEDLDPDTEESRSQDPDPSGSESTDGRAAESAASSGEDAAEERGRGESSSSEAAAAEPEGYLLLSSLTAGFASGVRTQLIPFLALAAKAKRTAVLPAASFGIPAFRSTNVDPKQGFAPLHHFLDVPALQRAMPCVRMITHEEWLAKQEPVDVVFLGGESEFGTEQKKASGVPDPSVPAWEECFATFAKTLRRKPGAVDKLPFWQGPWDFWGETAHVVRSQGLRVASVRCASLRASVRGGALFAADGAAKDLGSVMLANFPGLIRDSFWWHSQTAKENVRLFDDVPQDVCGTWPDFNKWPEIAPVWRSVADTVLDKRFNGEPFTCVHIRGEKLVLGAVKAGHTTIKTLPGNEYMERCIKGVESIILSAMQGKKNLFLISDLDPRTGSPSAVRDRFFRQWMEWSSKHISTAVGSGEGFCETDDARAAAAEGPDEVRHMLDIYPGNCAAGEAAICQRAGTIVRFGKGSMGAFVAGQKQAKKYETCEDVLAAVNGE